MAFTFVNGQWSVVPSTTPKPVPTGTGGAPTTQKPQPKPTPVIPNVPKPVAAKPLTDAEIAKKVAAINDQAKQYFETNGEQPSAAWWTAQTAGIDASINAGVAAARTAADEAAAKLVRDYNDKTIAAENLREDKYRAAQLALSQAAAGSAAARFAQTRIDEINKEKRDTKFKLEQEFRQNQFQIDSENRQNIAKIEAENRQNALAEIARIRGIEGGEAAAKVLESAIGTNTFAALARIKKLYDPMGQAAEDDFATQIDLLSKNFAKARGNVASAGTEFLETFADSVAYKDVPFSTFNAPTNPLLASLKAQGAGTGEVDAISALAQATATSTSDLAKWAAGQLNVGQQNFDSAVKNASRGATQSALQGLAGREPEIGAGMKSELNKRLGDIAMQRAGAEENVYAREQEAQDRATAMRAQTLAQYGTKPPAVSVAPVVSVAPSGRPIDADYASKEAAYNRPAQTNEEIAALKAKQEAEIAKKKAAEEAAAKAAGIASREQVRGY